MHFMNHCRWNKVRRDMHGYHELGCSHPCRDQLDDGTGFIGKIYNAIARPQYKFCAAKPGYYEYCPYYKSRFSKEESKVKRFRATNPTTKKVFEASSSSKGEFILELVKKAPHDGWYPDAVRQCVVDDLIEEVSA